MRYLLILLMMFTLCANTGLCDEPGTKFALVDTDVYEVQIGDASGSVEWFDVAKVTQKIPGIKVRIGAADKVLPHYRATTDSAFSALRANTAAVSAAYTKTHFHTRTTTETKTTAPTIVVNPTPVTVNPTPVTVNPTPVTVNPTPVVVNPTPVIVRPHYDWYRCPHTGRLIYGILP